MRNLIYTGAAFVMVAAGMEAAYSTNPSRYSSDSNLRSLSS
ncbi:hypothetical protein [Fischerella thermalis]